MLEFPLNCNIVEVYRINDYNEFRNLRYSFVKWRASSFSPGKELVNRTDGPICFVFLGRTTLRCDIFF